MKHSANYIRHRNIAPFLFHFQEYSKQNRFSIKQTPISVNTHKRYMEQVYALKHTQ